MTIRIIFWKIQKVLTRLAQLLYPNFDQISSRKHKSDSIITLKISEEHVGLDNYKNLPETDFRRILEIKNSILNPKTGLIWLNKKIIKESSYWNINELIKWEPYPYFPNSFSKYTILNPKLRKISSIIYFRSIPLDLNLSPFVSALDMNTLSFWLDLIKREKTSLINFKSYFEKT